MFSGLWIFVVMWGLGYIGPVQGGNKVKKARFREVFPLSLSLPSILSLLSNVRGEM